MLIASFPAGPLAANCYVVATAPGRECVVIDPGTDALPVLLDVVTEHRLRPVAVIATHGHLDHIGAATATCRRFDVPCWIHPDDRFLLLDPLAGLLPSMYALIAPAGEPVPEFEEPAEVLDLDQGELELAGLRLTVRHAPGHTAGSVLLRLPYPPEEADQDADRPPIDSLLFSGDVLFQGSVGRTDLPGGSPPVMLETLRREILPLPDGVVVLPGHGAQTTVGRERATNPYLQL